MLRTLLRSGAGLRRARTDLLPARSCLSTAVSNAKETKDASADLEPAPLSDDFGLNHLDGKESRASIHSMFAARAMASVKYDYFAQRAELECELDAAATFKGLTETAKQQAMGYLELMEDYGDNDFGLTLENLENAAQEERMNAEERYPALAKVAAGEELDQVDQWFQDMAEAAMRASERLDVAAAMMDTEGFEEEEVEDAPGATEKTI